MADPGALSRRAVREAQPELESQLDCEPSLARLVAEQLGRARPMRLRTVFRWVYRRAAVRGAFSASSR